MGSSQAHYPSSYVSLFALTGGILGATRYAYKSYSDSYNAAAKKRTDKKEGLQCDLIKTDCYKERLEIFLKPRQEIDFQPQNIDYIQHKQLYDFSVELDNDSTEDTDLQKLKKDLVEKNNSKRTENYTLIYQKKVYTDVEGIGCMYIRLLGEAWKDIFNKLNSSETIESTNQLHTSLQSLPQEITREIIRVYTETLHTKNESPDVRNALLKEIEELEKPPAIAKEFFTRKFYLNAFKRFILGTVIFGGIGHYLSKWQ